MGERSPGLGRGPLDWGEDPLANGFPLTVV